MPTVAVNAPKTPVTKGSNGIAMATLPNICKMPGPPAPFVPVPLPNIGTSDNAPLGYSTTVQIEGNPVAIQGASFLSKGDIASPGTGGGIVSNNAQGPTTFLGPGSFDVRIENKNVQLLADPMLNNNGPPGAPANSATMAGILQEPLFVQALDAGVLLEVAHICNVICDCKAEGDGSQDCVSKRLMAEEPLSNIKPEVPFNMNPKDGGSPDPYMSKKEPWRATRNWRIQGSRRPDVVIPQNTGEPWRGDNIKAVIEIKLGNDPWRDQQKEAYEKIAGQAPLIEVNDGRDGCQCDDDDDHGPPVPYPVERRVEEDEKEKKKKEEWEQEPFFPPGTGEVVATVALVAGVLAAGAALILSAPAWVPAAAGVAVVGGLAGLSASDSATPSGDSA